MAGDEKGVVGARRAGQKTLQGFQRYQVDRPVRRFGDAHLQGRHADPVRLHIAQQPDRRRSRSFWSKRVLRIGTAAVFSAAVVM